MSRRFAWLAGGIVAAIGIYTGAWFYVAGRLEAEVEAVLARARDGGAEAACANAEARGYPFRIGIFCDKVAYRDAAAGLSLDGSGLRNAAQIYQPTRIVGELDTIALLLGDGSGFGFAAKDIRYSTRTSDPLPERVSVTGQALVASQSRAGEGPVTLADAAAGEAHLRREGADLDFALNFDALQWRIVPAGGEMLPPLDGAADMRLTDGVAFLADQPTSLRGASGEIRQASVGTEGTGASIAGPFTVGADGLLDATLTLSIRNPQAFSMLLAASFPQIRPQVDQTAALIAALGDNPRLPLSVSKGVVRMGFLTLGRIPAF
ncbi:MAG: DUF2125 domain-containing protein [Mesorhizobium sp.]|nr:DUF2125 domain-containing protein [Mesorhizobium sp.]